MFSGEIETDFEIEKREEFEEIEAVENSFLKLCKSEFIETNSAKNVISRAEFEYVLPKNFSKNTVAAIPFIKAESEIFVGIETRDLPGSLQIADMGDQGIEGRAALGFVKPRHGTGVGGVGAKAVDGFGRKRDKSSVIKAAGGGRSRAICRNHRCLQAKFHRMSRATDGV